MSANNLSRPVIGIGVLVWRDKQLLLGKRLFKNQPPCWQFPGGHLENSESIAVCAQREVMEETGLLVKDFRHLGYTDQPFDVNGRQYITLLVSCDYHSGEVQTLEPDKCSGWQWFDYLQLPSPLFKPISLFISQQVDTLSAKGQHNDLYDLHRNAQILVSPPVGA